MSNPLSNVSVKWKLIGAFGLLFFLLVLFQMIYFPARQAQQQLAALQTKARSVVALVAHDVGAAYEFGDAASVEQTFQGAQSDEDLEFIKLLKPDGSDFASLHPERAPAIEPPSRIDELHLELQPERLLVFAPVKTEVGSDGILVAGFKLERIESERRENASAAIVLGLVLLVVGLGFAIATGQYLGRRLAHLGDLAQKVADGDLSGTVRVTLSGDELGRMNRDLAKMFDTLKALNESASKVSQGDLTVEIEGQGDLADAFRQMLENLRRLVSQIAASAAEINSASAQVFASTREQERLSSQQAGSIEETRRTMDSLLSSSRSIADTSGSVLQSAEQTLQNNQLIAERNSQLFAHVQRINEILEVIKDIANKSDLLALNASLEGTKAGEAGRGFSLVAAQMQRLAERVMGSVGDIKKLVADISESSRAAVLATEEGTKLADQTTQSARQIQLITRQQESATEQVTQSMDDASMQLSATVSGIQQSTQSMESLATLSKKLSELVAAFRLS